MPPNQSAHQAQSDHFGHEAGGRTHGLTDMLHPLQRSRLRSLDDPVKYCLRNKWIISYLRALLRRVESHQHRQDEGRRFSRSTLTLRDHVLGSEIQTQIAIPTSKNFFTSEPDKNTVKEIRRAKIYLPFLI